MAGKKRANGDGSIFQCDDERSVAEKSKRTYGTGSVFYREDIDYWVGAARDANGKNRQVYAKSKRKAELKLEELKERLARGEQQSSRLKLGEYMRQWLAGVERRRAFNTYRAYESATRTYIIPALGNIQLGRLTPHQVQAWVDELEDRGLKPNTIRQILMALKTALTTAERQGLVMRNVAKLVELPSYSQEEVVPLTPAEAERLIEVSHCFRQGALVTVALALGLRVGEATGLRWQDVDLAKRRVQVRVQAQRERGVWRLKELKTRTGRRTIPLPKAALEALRVQRVQVAEERLRAGALWTDWDLIFPSLTGQPTDRTQVERWLKAMCREAGVEPKRVHDLRHTCASLLLAQGVPLHEVSAILGHSSIRITNDVYGHFYDEERQKIADAMDRALKRKAR
jgi:integrase